MTEQVIFSLQTSQLRPPQLGNVIIAHFDLFSMVGISTFLNSQSGYYHSGVTIDVFQTEQSRYFEMSCFNYI